MLHIICVSLSSSMFVVQFESDLQKLKIERLRSFKTIEDYMEAFERKRTQDLRVRGLNGIHCMPGSCLHC